MKVIENLGVPIGPARLKCALLVYKVLQGAVTGSAARFCEVAGRSPASPFSDTASALGGRAGVGADACGAAP